jgi:hypothetical protein
MASDGNPAVRIVQCEKHGLKYNSILHDGCVRCRKERGEVGPNVPAEGSPTLKNQALITVGLVLVTGFVFFGLHRQLLRGFQLFLDPGGSELAVTPEEPSSEENLDWVVRSLQDPEVTRRMEEDPELRRLVEKMQDPETRRELARDPAALQRYLDEIDQRVYDTSDYDDGSG